MELYKQTLSPRFIIYIRDYLMDLGVDFNDFFNSMGICDVYIEENSELIPSNKVALIFEEVAKLLNDKNFAVNLAEKFHFESGSMIVLLVMASQNVQSMFNTLLKFDKYVDSAVFYGCQIKDKECCITIDISTAKGVAADHVNLYLVSLFCMMLCQATRNTPQINRVELAVSDLQGIDLSKFGINSKNIEINKCINKIYLPTDFLNTKLYSANHLLYKTLEKALNEYFDNKNSDDDWLEIASREILTQCHTCSPSFESVSNNMLIPKNQFQALLDKKSVSFEGFKNLAISNRAKYFLAHTQMSLCDIASELGYADTNSFCDAFTGTEKISPSSYRKNHCT